MNLKDLNIEEEAFDIFIALDPSQKIQFLADAIDYGIDSAMQTQLHDLQSGHSGKGIALVQLQVIHVGPHILNVMSVGNVMILNSDNLKVIRKFVRNMWTNGHMMLRRPDIRKTKTQDLFKYFLAYELIGSNNSICDN
jgi:hypothetical protein